MGRDALDPILLTVITNRLESIAREMGAGMLRSSRSPIIAETKDFVTAIFDSQLRLVGQTAYIPVLMGGSAIAVRSISEHFAGDIREGDVMVLNDPYRGNSHLPDITVVKPIFLEGRLWFWVLASHLPRTLLDSLRGAQAIIVTPEFDLDVLRAEGESRRPPRP